MFFTHVPSELCASLNVSIIYLFNIDGIWCHLSWKFSLIKIRVFILLVMQSLEERRCYLVGFFAGT